MYEGEGEGEAGAQSDSSFCWSSQQVSSLSVSEVAIPCLSQLYLLHVQAIVVVLLKWCTELHKYFISCYTTDIIEQFCLPVQFR